MNKIESLFKKNKLPVIIAVIQWFITTILQVDRAFFVYNNENKILIIIKLLYLIFLIVIWCFLNNCYKKIKNEDPDYKRGFQIFCVHFFLMMVLLLILWPGTWSLDDLWTLEALRHYRSFFPWQHILTGIYQDVLLQVLPFPGGIIFLQNVLVSLCIAFSVMKLEKVFKIKQIKKCFIDILLKILPFLFPPVLMYQFSGYRMGLYIYLELVMIVLLICAYKEKQKWSWKYTLLLSILTIIVSTWRTESFVYIPCVSILLFLVPRDSISNRKKIFSVLFIIFGFINLNHYQNHALNDSDYQIISLLRPGAALVRMADYVDDSKELAIINKVTDVKIIRDNPSLNGEQLYWKTKCVKNRNNNHDDYYSNEDYYNYLKAFIKLSLKYPIVVVSERWNLFMRGAGITGDSYNNVTGAARLFEKNNGNNAAKVTLDRGWIANSPVLKNARKSVVYAFGGMKSDGTRIYMLKQLMWNAIIPIIMLLGYWIRTLIKKEWFYFIIFSAIVFKLLVVVLTQPSPWLMYLLSFYLLGYTLLTYQAWIYFSQMKDVKEDE